MRAVVNYAKTLKEGDFVFLPEIGKALPVEKIRNAQGRKPAVGSNLSVWINGFRFTLNTERPVRIIRGD